MANRTLIYLADIGVTPVARYGTAFHVASGNAYEPRLTVVPSFARSIKDPASGVTDSDPLTVTLDNSDAALASWLTGNTEARGASLSITEVDATAGTNTVVWSGVIRDVEAQTGNAGDSIVVLRAEADTNDLLRTPVPKVVTELDTFSYNKDVVPLEGLGMPIPVVIRGTREHVPIPYVKKDPANDRYEWCAMHDGTDQLVRGYVNDIYTLERDGLLVVRHAQWSQDRTTHAGYVLVTKTRALAAGAVNIYADLECSEFDSARTGVVRHWLFRRTLTDETANVTLVDTNATLGDWRFASAATETADTSGNNYVLTHMPNSTSPATLTAEQDGDYALSNVYLGSSNSYYRAGGANDFDFGVNDDWHIEARVALSLAGGFNLQVVDGVICGKWKPAEPGWLLRVFNGRAQLILQGRRLANSAIIELSVSGTSNLADGEWHTIVANVRRDTDVAEIYVDGVLENSISVALADHTDGFTNDYTLGVACHGATPQNTLAAGGFPQFVGRLGRLAIYDGRAGSNVAYVTGHSGQSTSALTLGTSTARVAEFHNSALDFGNVDLTFLLWLKRDTDEVGINSTELIVGKHNGTGWKFEMLTTGLVRVTLQDGNTVVTLNTTTTIGESDGEYHCLVVTVTSSTATLYVDGRSEASAQANGVGSMDQSNADLVFGSRCAVDEFGIVTEEALSASQVRAHYMTASGNPARAVRNLLTNDTWGLNQTVDTTSFDAAEDEFANRKIRFAGAHYESLDAQALLDRLLVFGATLKTDGTNWDIRFPWKSTATPRALGVNDGFYDNVFVVNKVHRRPLDRTPNGVIANYRRLNDPKLGDRRFSLRTFIRNLSNNGAERRLVDLHYVREWSVADRIAYYEFEVAKADIEGSVRADLEHRDIEPGDRLTMAYADAGLTDATVMRARRVVRGANDVTIDFFEDAPDAVSTYTPTVLSLPDDILPDDTADYSTTNPSAPTDMYLVENSATAYGVRVMVRATMPNDSVAQAIVTGAHVAWQYAVSDSTDQTSDDDANAFEWQETVVEAQPGTTVEWGTASIDPGRRVNIRVHAVDRYGKLSGAAAYVEQGLVTGVLSKEGDTVLTFTSATDTSVQARGYYAIQELSGRGATIIEELTVSSGTATLSSSPNISNNQKVLIFVRDRPWQQEATATSRGQFSLGGTDNKTVTFGGNASDVDGQFCLAVFVRAD